MIALILVALWFSLRARIVGRNPIGWGFVGIIVFVTLRVFVNILAINSRTSSETEAQVMAAGFTLLLFGGTILFSFIIQPKRKTEVNADLKVQKEVKTAGNLLDHNFENGLCQKCKCTEAFAINNQYRCPQ